MCNPDTSQKIRSFPVEKHKSKVYQNVDKIKANNLCEKSGRNSKNSGSSTTCQIVVHLAWRGISTKRFSDALFNQNISGKSISGIVAQPVGGARHVTRPTHRTPRNCQPGLGLTDHIRAGTRKACY